MQRMMCVDCGHVGVPDTLLPGSDFLELVLWSCLALPGLLYCGARHWLRMKACAQCGGASLLRESRAAALRPSASRPHEVW